MLDDKVFPLPTTIVNTYEAHMATLKKGIQDLRKLQNANVDVSDILRELEADYNGYEIKYEVLKNSNKLSAHVDIYAINEAIKALDEIFNAEGTQG